MGCDTTVPSARKCPGPPVIQKYMNIAGATPKFTKSASESSSAPSFELALRSLATRPSMPSQTQATRSAQSADRKRPSEDSEIDVMPAHAASEVMRFGKIARRGILSSRRSCGLRRRLLSLNLLMIDVPILFPRQP